MNPKPLQDLSEAFNSIIAMMLSALRARGLRALFDLPNIIIASIYLRRLGREFAALVAAIQAGTLALSVPATAGPDQQPTCAQPAEPRSAVPCTATRARRPGRARPVSAAPASATSQTRTATAYPRPSHAPARRAIQALRPRPSEADRRP